MIKIAFFDVDGTIIDMERRQITEKMVNTLQILQKKGIKICKVDPMSRTLNKKGLK